MMPRGDGCAAPVTAYLPYYGVGSNRRPSKSPQWPLSRLLVSVCLTALLLNGCASTLPSPEKVYIRVPAPCLTADQLPAAPKATTDADLAKMNDYDLVITLAADRLEYRRYSSEAAAVLQACVK